MPKRTNSHVADVPTDSFGFLKSVVDRGNDLFDRKAGMDLCSAVFGRVEETIVFYERVWK